MRKALFLLSAFLIIISFSNSASAWDTTAAKFYPLQVGNLYTFTRVEYIIDCQPLPGIRFSVKISGQTTLSNGKNYYVFQANRYAYQFNTIWKYQRIDSTTMNVYGYDTTNNRELLLDSLLAIYPNNFKCQRFTTSFPSGTASPLYSINFFGSTRIEKRFLCSPSITNYSLVEGIGFTGYYSCQDFGNGMNLRGCFINGVLYGDTVTTSIQQISSEVPDNFSLSQNYPNPFNPETNIKFALLKSGEVKLTVFDAIGKEISVLLNEYKTQGVYTATFDAANFPSGTYYYKLETDGFSEVKKMILLK